jgi:hypothetical protein
MLFMSERQKAVTVRNEKPVFNVKTGEQIGKIRRLHANLERGYMPAWAVAIAEETFTMGGKPPTVPIHRWIATYDSAVAQRLEGWDDEERALIEAKLLAQGDVVLIEPPKVEAPYAQYDKHRKVVGKRTLEQALADITASYELAGFDIDQAVAYELQNGNDPRVVEHLRSLAPEPAVAETLIEA